MKLIKVHILGWSMFLILGVFGLSIGTAMDFYGDVTIKGSSDLVIEPRSITVDTGGGLDINLGTASGDDFTVGGLTAEGDTDNVGIGTTSPLGILHLEGANTLMVGKDTSGAADEKIWKMYFLDSDFRLMARNDADSSGETAFQITRTGATIDDTLLFGNVGIGTTSPGYNLEISSDSSTTRLAIKTTVVGDPYLDLISDSETWRFNVDGNASQSAEDTLLIKNGTGGTIVMSMDTSGNVGIGDTSPSYKLEVNGTGNFTGALTAASYADNTPFYDGDALAAIKLIKGKDGHIDHSTLPEFAQINNGGVTTSITLGERVPVAEKDAFDTIDITETKEKKDSESKAILSKTLTSYEIKEGKVTEVQTPEYETEEVIVGTEKKLKEGVKLDTKTGELYTQTETEVSTTEEKSGRNLGAMISVLTKAVQQLTARIEALEATE